MAQRGASLKILTNDNSPAAIGQFGGSSLLFKLTSADFNSTADQIFTKIGSFSNYCVKDILVTNASISLTVAAGGIYNATAKGGQVLVGAAQVYTALTSALKASFPSILLFDRQSGNLYLSLTLAQGAPATADIYVYGYALS